MLFKLGFTIYSTTLFINASIIKYAIYNIISLRIYIKVITLLAIITIIHKRLIYINSTSLT
jgi:hypothetical protein